MQESGTISCNSYAIPLYIDVNSKFDSSEIAERKSSDSLGLRQLVPVTRHVSGRATKSPPLHVQRI